MHGEQPDDLFRYRAEAPLRPRLRRRGGPRRPRGHLLSSRSAAPVPGRLRHLYEAARTHSRSARLPERHGGVQQEREARSSETIGSSAEAGEASAGSDERRRHGTGQPDGRQGRSYRLRGWADACRNRESQEGEAGPLERAYRRQQGPRDTGAARVASSLRRPRRAAPDHKAVSGHHCGQETGSGKTTQLTQFLYEDGYGQNGMIGCTPAQEGRSHERREACCRRDGSPAWQHRRICHPIRRLHVSKTPRSST